MIQGLDFTALVNLIQTHISSSLPCPQRHIPPQPLTSPQSSSTQDGLDRLHAFQRLYVAAEYQASTPWLSAGHLAATIRRLDPSCCRHWPFKLLLFASPGSAGRVFGGCLMFRRQLLCHSAVPPFRRSAVPPIRQFAGPQIRRSADPPVRRSAGPPVRRFAGPPSRCSACLFFRRFAIPPIRPSADLRVR